MARKFSHGHAGASPRQKNMDKIPPLTSRLPARHESGTPLPSLFCHPRVQSPKRMVPRDPRSVHLLHQSKGKAALRQQRIRLRRARQNDRCREVRRNRRRNLLCGNACSAVEGMMYDMGEFYFMATLRCQYQFEQSLMYAFRSVL